MSGRTGGGVVDHFIIEKNWAEADRTREELLTHGRSMGNFAGGKKTFMVVEFYIWTC